MSMLGQILLDLSLGLLGALPRVRPGAGWSAYSPDSGRQKC